MTSAAAHSRWNDKGMQRRIRRRYVAERWFRFAGLGHRGHHDGGGAVDDDPEAAVLVVVEQQDDRSGEARVLQLGGGHEQPAGRGRLGGGGEPLDGFGHETLTASSLDESSAPDGRAARGGPDSSRLDV